MRRNLSGMGVSPCQFQFTHPGRGATAFCQGWEYHPTSFNSRTPGGVRPHMGRAQQDIHHVSIHAPREGCDLLYVVVSDHHEGFNSRTPGGVRPTRACNSDSSTTVSIHAPREGCDPYWDEGIPDDECFNSRTPGGVRLKSPAIIGKSKVSIHAPREGCDLPRCPLAV